MSWFQDLIDVYDKYYDDPDSGILPIYHVVNNCDFEITIDVSGSFVSARQLDKKEKLTIMPTTKKSSVRTSGAEAMPLCEKLDYICRDFSILSDCGKDSDIGKFDLYTEELKKWATSEFTCDSIKAIYTYVTSETVVHDLESVGVICVNDKGKYSNLTRSYVRFRVLGCTTPETWLDRNMYELFIQYNRSTCTEYGLSYITGKNVPTKEKHDRYIRTNGDGTKLISSNDESGYTFRGLFHNYSDAMSIGYDESDKLHRALQWLIRKQGFHIGKDGRYFVLFSTSSDTNVDMIQKSSTVYDDEDFGIVPQETTNKQLCEKFRKSIFGGKEYKYNDNAIMLCLDSPSKGRLSIIEYNKLGMSSFMNNVLDWHGSTCYSAIDKDGKLYIKSPSVYDFLNVAFGDFDIKTKRIVSHNDTRRQLHELLRCIVNGYKFPHDIFNSIIKNASNPNKYDTSTFSYVLKIANAAIRKYHIDMNGGITNMILNSCETDRNYLFGCLLAVFDTVEYSTFSKSEKVSRQTSAKRLWSIYQKKPYETCMRIRDMISPYLAKSKYSGFYEKMIQDIMVRFDRSSFESDAPLTPTYILGYYQMKQSMFTKEEIKDMCSEEDTYYDKED